MLNVKIPDYLTEVSEYIIRLIFEDFWNLSVELGIHQENSYVITNPENNSQVIIPAVFINQEKNQWLKKRKIDHWNFKSISLGEFQHFPVWFENLQPDSNNTTEIDFPGSIFFLLNRYHEHVESLNLDKHDRIEASETLLVRQGMIYQPIADMYLEAFYNFLNGFFNLPEKQKKQFEVLPSHDVDRPFEYLYYTLPRLAKRLCGDILIRQSFSKAKDRFWFYKEVKAGNLQADPYNTFEWIMTESEKQNRVSTFHFITQNTDPSYDQDYYMENPEIRELLLQIHQRNHNIALHPSYGSTEINSQIKEEFELLRTTCNKLNIRQNKWKSRNHYMKWNENTLNELEIAGLDIDQTLGFVQQPGFRCGTAQMFAAFNYKTMEKSSVNIEPLLLMELSLFSEKYLNLENNFEEAWDIVKALKEECRRYGGKFTFLWHNNQLINIKMKEFYKNCLK